MILYMMRDYNHDATMISASPKEMADALAQRQRENDRIVTEVIIAEEHQIIEIKWFEDWGNGDMYGESIYDYEEIETDSYIYLR